VDVDESDLPLTRVLIEFDTFRPWQPANKIEKVADSGGADEDIPVFGCRFKAYQPAPALSGLLYRDLRNAELSER